MKVLHIITGLKLGGAEMMLLSLLRKHRSYGIESQVISLLGDGPVGSMLREEGFRVDCLELSPVFPSPSKIMRLAHLVSSIQPDIIQTWMYHADFLGGLISKLVSATPVIWGIHITELRSSARSRRTVMIAKLCAFLSSVVPHKIVSCSEEAVSAHLAMGYDAAKFCVINNGFDLSHFRPKKEETSRVKKELDVPLDVNLVGLFARYHPQKDHRNFIRAAEYVLQSCPRAEFVLCGSDITWENEALAHLIKSTGKAAKFHLLGERNDIPRLLSALDLLVLSSSSGEAFPMVIGEAMACETLCAVTDVGDSSEMLSGYGRVVPPRDPQALARACVEILSLSDNDRRALGRLARERISDRYSLEAVATKYRNLYAQAIADSS